MKSIRNWGLPLAAIVVLLGIWEAAVRIFNVAPYLLPAPSRIWKAFIEIKSLLPEHIITTGTEAILGLLLGAFAGAVIAVALWSMPFIRRTFLPLLVLSQTIPMVVLAPILVLWFGFGLLPKVIAVALVTFFPVAIATISGLFTADKDAIELLKSMGANRRQVARYVLIPSAANTFFGGLRIAGTYAVAAAVIGEWVGATSGIGLLLTRAQASFRVDRFFVAVGIIALMSMILFILIDLIARALMPWQRITSENKSLTNHK